MAQLQTNKRSGEKQYETFMPAFKNGTREKKIGRLCRGSRRPPTLTTARTQHISVISEQTWTCLQTFSMFQVEWNSHVSIAKWLSLVTLNYRLYQALCLSAWNFTTCTNLVVPVEALFKHWKHCSRVLKICNWLQHICYVATSRSTLYTVPTYNHTIVGWSRLAVETSSVRNCRYSPKCTFRIKLNNGW